MMSPGDGAGTPLAPGDGALSFFVAGPGITGPGGRSEPCVEAIAARLAKGIRSGFPLPEGTPKLQAVRGFVCHRLLGELAYLTETLAVFPFLAFFTRILGLLTWLILEADWRGFCGDVVSVDASIWSDIWPSKHFKSIRIPCCCHRGVGAVLLLLGERTIQASGTRSSLLCGVVAIDGRSGFACRNTPN